MLKTVSTINGLISPTFSGDVTLSDGNLVIGTSGKGIDFSATAGTGTSELLADYEEGTWTPVIVGTTTPGTGTYSAQVGTYTKIGNLVTVRIYILVTAHTGTGNMQIAGLPFAGASGANSGVAIGRLSGISLSAGHIATMYTSNTNIVIQQYPTGGGSSVAVPIDTAFSVNITATYDV